MIKLGVIEPSDSEWSSALHMVRKKKWRLETMWRLQKLERSDRTRLLPNPTYSGFHAAIGWLKFFFQKLIWLEPITKFLWNRQTYTRQPSLHLLVYLILPGHRLVCEIPAKRFSVS